MGTLNATRQWRVWWEHGLSRRSRAIAHDRGSGKKRTIGIGRPRNCRAWRATHVTACHTPAARKCDTRVAACRAKVRHARRSVPHAARHAALPRAARNATQNRVQGAALPARATRFCRAAQCQRPVATAGNPPKARAAQCQRPVAASPQHAAPIVCAWAGGMVGHLLAMASTRRRERLRNVEISHTWKIQNRWRVSRA